MVINGLGRMNPGQQMQGAEDVVDSGYRGMCLAFKSVGEEAVGFVEGS